MTFRAILAIYFLLAGVVPSEAACGLASWYGAESGSRTANGEFFDGTSMTVAHKTLPFGTKLRVTLGGKSALVRVNDRGPFVRGRSMDLSRAVAKKIGLLPKGVARVCWEKIK
jgi:rare lipoprotein A